MNKNHATTAAKDVPHGERECEDCTFWHPERAARPCSVFKTRQNQDKDCSAYIPKGNAPA